MLLRLSRLSSWLAAAAAIGAIAGPAAQRALCTDVAIAFGIAAILTWRLGVAEHRRREAGEDAVPEPRSVDAAALAEGVARIRDAVHGASGFEPALHAAADALRGELGAETVRVFRVAHAEAGATLSLLVAATPGFRAPAQPLADSGPVLARAIAQGRPAADLPHAVAVPVLADGRAVAAIELRGFALAFEEPGVRELLDAACTTLAPHAPHAEGGTVSRRAATEARARRRTPAALVPC